MKTCCFILFLLLQTSVLLAQVRDRGDYEVQKAEDYIRQEKYADAVPLLHQAEGKGNKQGKFLLGTLYLMGAGGLPQKESLGKMKIGSAADRGCVDAMIWMLNYYVEHSGETCYRDLNGYIEKLTSSNNPKGYYYGGIYNVYSESGDVEKGVQYFLKAAELGDADAEFELAICCINDRCDLGNYEDAVLWLKKSFEHGSEVAEKFFQQKYIGMYKDYNKFFNEYREYYNSLKNNE